MAFLERIRLEWGGYSHLIDGNLEVVKNYEQSRVLVYRLCNSRKCWTDIAFGRGYDQLRPLNYRAKPCGFLQGES